MERSDIHERHEWYPSDLFPQLASLPSTLERGPCPTLPGAIGAAAAPGLRSIGELACQGIAVRAGWFHDALEEGGDDFGALAQWDGPESSLRPAVELVSGLAASWQVMQEALARFTPTDLEATIQKERRGRTYTFTPGWVVWHVLEHDLHHGGEIAYSLGMHGLKAPDI